MNHLFEDLRFAARSLAKNKGFAIVALLTLAIGIGATTAIFSVVSTVLLRPLPFPQPDRLIKVEERHADWANTGFTYANFADIAAQTRTLEKLAAYRSWTFTLTGSGEPESVDGYRVSGQFFNALNAPPQLGRTLHPEDARAGSEAVVVLSDRLWRRRFAADPALVGKLCKINGAQVRVVGV